MDVLLVLGNVTAKQYKPVCYAMLNRGLKPKIVRVSTKLSTEVDFGNAALGEASTKSLDDEQADDFTDARIGDLKEQIVGESFRDASIDQVVAIIREPLGLTESYQDKMLWLTKDLPINLPDYTVMIGDDGSFWLDGAGYGDLYVS